MYVSVAKKLLLEIGFWQIALKISHILSGMSRKRSHFYFVQILHRIKLNVDQEQIANFSAKGHNLLITGQAGVGKSEVVKRIISDANARGRKIACQVYDPGVASTVHSFYGLMTAELPWR